MKTPPHLIPVMNNTKWDELRLVMYELEPKPAWHTKCWENGFVTPWDREWYYHSRDGGYELTEWVEIRAESKEQKQSVLSVLDRVHVPTEEISDGFVCMGIFIQARKLNMQSSNPTLKLLPLVAGTRLRRAP